jgi:hypothetical protein
MRQTKQHAILLSSVVVNGRITESMNILVASYNEDNLEEHATAPEFP